MTRQQVTAAVNEAIRQVQVMSGRKMGAIRSNTRPIGNLDGFDSLSGIEATVILAGLIGQDFPDNYNPFVFDTDRRAATLDEIVQNVCARVGVIEGEL